MTDDLTVYKCQGKENCGTPQMITVSAILLLYTKNDFLLKNSYMQLIFCHFQSCHLSKIMSKSNNEIKKPKETRITQNSCRQSSTLYFESPVVYVRSLNSSWIVVTSDTELSGPQRGGCAEWVKRLTSEYGIFDLVLKAGKRRSPRSTCNLSNHVCHIIIISINGQWYSHVIK